MKEQYLSLMEKTLGAYSDADIRDYFDTVKREGLSEHGFPRLTANIGVLIAHGIRTDLYGIFLEMMDFCCEYIPRVDAANNFSVREILFAIDAVRDMVGMEKVSRWHKSLSGIIPEECYVRIAKTEADRPHNFATFAALSEQVRIFFGISERTDFVELQLATQVPRLDGNGMYRDPHEPMVYDVVTRGLLSELLYIGYRGKYYDIIDSALKRAGLMTLGMQSVSGEIAYGGRSNSFLHNEASLAIIFEYEAKRYIREGNIALAEKFKTAANAALANIDYWLDKKPITHIKNRFPRNSKYGCESYAYFDKYMITAASFLYVAYRMCDESVQPGSSQAAHPVAFSTSPDFHKTFLRAGEYFLELDTAADKNYDSNGIGRVHKLGAPSSICISLPCAAQPHYTLDGESANISLCTGIISDNEEYFEADYAEYVGAFTSCDARSAMTTATVRYENGASAALRVTLTADGLNVTSLAEKPLLMLPVFLFDGQEYSVITHTENVLEINYSGFVCRYTSSAKITETDRLGRNRNGYYKAYLTHGEGEISVNVAIEKK
ncbi:MAG: hypothetical protein J6V09_01790 [Clostridia bacterium]|nr:hypothetical protein [Clostridia bacterium]